MRSNSILRKRLANFWLAVVLPRREIATGDFALNWFVRREQKTFPNLSTLSHCGGGDFPS
jgi:hypothetical protein